MDLGEGWWPFVTQLGLLPAALFAGWVLYRLVFRALERIASRARGTLGVHLVGELRPGARWMFPLLAAQLALPAAAGLPEALAAPLHHALILGIIASVAWLGIGVVGAIAEFVRGGHRLDVQDNLAARRVHTQVEVLERTAEVLLVVLAVGFALMTFPRVRELGTGLLASAGVVGLVVGLAARPLLENLIAGVQLAITQPIRLDDVVIVRGEWGRIEEITTTYVVVRIWDERRLIVPFSTFIQEPFENWTRRSAEILGTVYLYADYTIAVEDVRRALGEIVRRAAQWDGRVCNLQVTGATEQTVELRALVSAADAGQAWELRVFVREQLLEWLQREHPGALPRARVSLLRAGEGAPPADPGEAVEPVGGVGADQRSTRS